MKRLSLKTKKVNGIQKVDLNKKKSTDYTEMAYKEAVSKLKYLLADSYVSKPITGGLQGTKDIYQFDNTKINKFDEERDDGSMIIDNSKAKKFQEDINKVVNPNFGSLKTMYQMKACNSLASSTADIQSVPPELNSFIEQQEEYIQQLQQESQFCRNQLTNLIHKVREVVVENEALHYKNKTGFFNCALNEYIHVDDNDNDNSKRKLSVQTEASEIIKPKILEGPNILFESRISELEAQLTEAKLELRKTQEESQFNLKQLSESCLKNDASKVKTQLEQALHAKYETEMKMEDLQKSLAFAQNKETEAAQKVKQTINVIQQIEFEKNQFKIEIKTLKEELDRQCDKLKEATQEASRRIAEERQQIERKYNHQVEQLSNDVASHWNVVNKSKLESEKQRRELTELKKELSQKQILISNLKKELQNEISNLQSKLDEALTEKDGIEQEVLAAKLAAERNERQNHQEQSRLQIEINSYKQRLERTETDLVHLKRENLRLSEQITSLEKEINISKSTCPENFSLQASSISKNEKELASMIMDMETKHAATVAGLEDVLNNQATLVSQLTIECQSLTQRLEASNFKHKEDMANLQTNIEYLSDKIQNAISNQQELASMKNKDESLISYSHSASLNSSIETQKPTVPYMVYQEYDIKANKFIDKHNKLLDNDSSDERKYDIRNETDNDFNNAIKKYDENKNEDSDKKIHDQQEHIESKQNPNEMTHNLP
ncbi:serologically defined colon cancer antigen 8 homolog isoform X1 [Colletes gigas]|uniref:serologically defined colon cancer antigen 8 homolog isoform X1 n=1 Tax=Colletes gigas TaxID=935657 RepID=UPI001C9A86C6|nr:serologically defined colon cancer antigen 8 homolog isoform X1 [Colletes gigas]